MKISLFVLAVLAVLAIASAQDRVVFGGRHASFDAVPSKGNNWELVRRATPTDSVSLVFAIKQRNLEMIDTLLMEVSDPESARYGDYLSFEQVGEMFRDDEAVAAVESWLNANKVQFKTNPNGEFVTADLSVEQAESLLGNDVTQFHTFSSIQTGKVIHRTLSYALPSEVASAVEFVGHTLHFPASQPPVIATKLSSNDAGNVDPALLHSYYNIPSIESPATGNSMAVFEALGQNYNPTDLAAFQKHFNLPNNPIQKVIGPNTPFVCVLNPNDCVEAILDVEYLLAIAQNIPTWFWSIDANDQTPFLDWSIAVAGTADAPLVHSISYGGVEPEEDPAEANRFNSELGKLGLRGITVVIASGDDGVANFPARQDPTKCGFNPSFPATSPYATAVGATMGPENNQTEVACTSDNGGGITTGGGFSGIFQRPTYQNTAVSNYMNNGPNLPPSSMYNVTGRGYPDVSMLGHNYEIIMDSQTVVGSGTSASTPVFAGVLARINNMRLNSGKKPLGFLNQALYKAPSSIFRDITSGENNCAAGPNPVCCNYGFTATSGWDPLTGLGSIDFVKFSSYFAGLP